jgi:predicted dehydrogenase
MNPRVRVAVIGLGRRWRRRYKPALLALEKLFTIGAVCDSVQARADAEANAIGCRAAGVGAVFERKDIDAILLADRQWFGLWPIERACASRKPVFCAVPIERDHGQLERLTHLVDENALPVMVEFTPRFALPEALATELGQPRLVRCETIGQAADESLVPLVDWCVGVFKAEPIGSSTATLGTTQSWTLDFADGKCAEIVRRFAPGVRHTRFEIFAQRGRALIEPPGFIAWTTRSGQRVQLSRHKTAIGRTLLKRFHHTVIRAAPPEPSLRDAYRLVQWLHPHS